MESGNYYRLKNTCNIDNWLAFFAINEDVCRKVIDSVRTVRTVEHRSLLTSILQLCQQKQFIPAKMFLGQLNGITRDATLFEIDFNGNEEVNFLYHLRHVFTTTLMTECSSTHCPKQVRRIITRDVPALPMPPDNITEATIQEELARWMMAEQQPTTSCMQKFLVNPPPLAPVKEDYYTSSATGQR